MQEIKLIAIDLDGTLLSSEKTISEANLTALRAAVAVEAAMAVALADFKLRDRCRRAAK